MHAISKVKAPVSPRLDTQPSPSAPRPLGVLVLSLGQERAEVAQFWERHCGQLGVSYQSLRADPPHSASRNNSYAALDAGLETLRLQWQVSDRTLVHINTHGYLRNCELYLGDARGQCAFKASEFIHTVVKKLEQVLGRKWQGLLNINCCFARHLVPFLQAQGLRAIVYTGSKSSITRDAVETFEAVIQQRGKCGTADEDKDAPLSNEEIAGMWQQAKDRSGEHIYLVMGDDSELHKTTDIDFDNQPRLVANGKRDLTLLAKLQHGSLDSVLQVLGSSPQTVIRRGLWVHTPPLLVCAGSRRETLPKIDLLLSLGENIDRQDASGQCALHRAAMNNNLPAVQGLLARGATPGIRNEDGELPLHLATDPTVLDALRSAARPATGPMPGRLNTELQQACEGGHLAMLASLALNEGELRDRGAQGHTALGIVVLRDDLDMAELLLCEGADPNALLNEGETLLGQAVLMGSAAMFALLLKHGARPGREAAWDPLLFKAIRALEGSQDALRFLQQILKAGVDVRARDAQGRTALHYALDLEKPGLMHELVRHGADLDATDGQGRTVIERIREKYAVTPARNDQPQWFNVLADEARKGKASAGN